MPIVSPLNGGEMPSLCDIATIMFSSIVKAFRAVHKFRRDLETAHTCSCRLGIVRRLCNSCASSQAERPSLIALELTRFRIHKFAQLGQRECMQPACCDQHGTDSRYHRVSQLCNRNTCTHNPQSPASPQEQLQPYTKPSLHTF